MFGEVYPQNTWGPLSRDLKSKKEWTEGEGQVMKRLFCTFTTCKMSISAVGLERGRPQGHGSGSRTTQLYHRAEAT